MPAGAIKLNVTGKRLAGPIPGFGKMWQKTYQVRLPSDRVLATDVIATWKQQAPEFWPEDNRFCAAEESFTLMTPQGHMFAGWITFSAAERDGETQAQAQVLMRASDPIFELGLTMGGHRQEDKFWGQTLSKVAAAFDSLDAPVDTQVVCVDKRRQWSKWANVWHFSAIRSSIYRVAAPVRGVRSLTQRGRAVG